MDWALLRELQADARLSYSELSRRVHLSPPAVAERVRRLEESGVITGYHAHVDLARAGRPVVAMIRMSCYGARCILHDPQVVDWPEIREIHRITGDACSMLKVAAGSIEAVRGGHRPTRPVRAAVQHDGALQPRCSGIRSPRCRPGRPRPVPGTAESGFAPGPAGNAGPHTRRRIPANRRREGGIMRGLTLSPSCHPRRTRDVRPGRGVRPDDGPSGAGRREHLRRGHAEQRAGRHPAHRPGQLRQRQQPTGHRALGRLRAGGAAARRRVPHRRGHHPGQQAGR